MFAERREPLVLRSAGIAALEHNGIVLVHREQAFAAAGGAQHGHGIGTGRLAVARLQHAPLGDHRGLAGQCAEFARHDRGDVDARRALLRAARSATCGSLAQAAPSAGDVSASSISSPSDTASSARRRNRSRADKAPITKPGFVGDTEMTDLEPAHATDGAIDEGVRRNGGKRPAHELLDAELERALALDRQRPQHVALGDDAGGKGGKPFAGTPGGATRARRRGRDQFDQRLAQRPVGTR